MLASFHVWLAEGSELVYATVMFKYFLKSLEQFGWPIWLAFGGFAIGMSVAIATAPFVGIPVSIGAVALFWFVMFRPMAEHERLMDIGMDAEATILKVFETGSTMKINGGMPRAGIRIELEVRPRDRSPYKGTVKTFISMFQLDKFRPGNVLAVKFDPANPQKITIV